MESHKNKTATILRYTIGGVLCLGTIGLGWFAIVSNTSNPKIQSVSQQSVPSPTQQLSTDLNNSNIPQTTLQKRSSPKAFHTPLFSTNTKEPHPQSHEKEPLPKQSSQEQWIIRKVIEGAIVGGFITALILYLVDPLSVFS